MHVAAHPVVAQLELAQPVATQPVVANPVVDQPLACEVVLLALTLVTSVKVYPELAKLSVLLNILC